MRFITNKKGSALLQVLIMGSIIASISVLLLRFAVTRTTNMVKTTRKIPARMYAEACMSQITLDAVGNEFIGRPPRFDTGIIPGATVQPIYTYWCKLNLGNATNTGTLREEAMTLKGITGGTKIITTPSGAVSVPLPSTLYEVKLTVERADQLK
jgi:hypothetical protein